MFHPSLDHSIAINRWRTKPPSGRQMALALTGLIPAEQIEAKLAGEMSRSVDYVRWCLNSDAIVPACLLAAALRLSAGQHHALRVDPISPGRALSGGR